MVPEIKDGKERMVEHKLFPGYVLVKMVMNDDTWYVVRNTRGCTGFVGPASKPVPLTAEEVEKMGVEKAAPLSVDFAVGDTVQITAGPLEGFMAVSYTHQMCIRDRLRADRLRLPLHCAGSCKDRGVLHRGCAAA